MTEPVRTIAYKVLDENYKSTYQHFTWPLPIKRGLGGKEEPGPWLEIEGDPVLCIRGFHGWMTKKRAFMDYKTHDNAHVYRMEFEGPTIDDGEKICGTRARLVCETLKHDFDGFDWDEFENSELDAFAVVEKAHKLHMELRDNGVDVRGSAYTYDPVIPPFHTGPFKPSSINPEECRVCGFPRVFHGQLDRRALLANKFIHFDRWELLLYIDQILAGKLPGITLKEVPDAS